MANHIGTPEELQKIWENQSTSSSSPPLIIAEITADQSPVSLLSNIAEQSSSPPEQLFHTRSNRPESHPMEAPFHLIRQCSNNASDGDEPSDEGILKTMSEQLYSNELLPSTIPECSPEDLADRIRGTDQVSETMLERFSGSHCWYLFEQLHRADPPTIEILSMLGRKLFLRDLEANFLLFGTFNPEKMNNGERSSIQSLLDEPYVSELDLQNSSDASSDWSNELSPDEHTLLQRLAIWGNQPAPEHFSQIVVPGRNNVSREQLRNLEQNNVLIKSPGNNQSTYWFSREGLQNRILEKMDAQQKQTTAGNLLEALESRGSEESPGANPNLPQLLHLAIRSDQKPKIKKYARELLPHLENVRAHELILDLLNLLSSCPLSSEEEKDIREKKGDAHVKRNQFSEARRHYRNLLSQPDTSESLKGRMKRKLAHLESQLNNKQKAKSLYEESVRTYRRIEDSEIKDGLASAYTKALIEKAKFLHNRKLEPGTAIECCEKALQILKKQTASKATRHLRAQTHVEFGLILAKKGKSEKAINHLQDALESARYAQNPELISKSLEWLGKCYEHMESSERPETYYEEGISSCTEFFHRRGIAQFSGYMGLLRHDQGDLDAAIKQYKNELEISRELNLTRRQGRALGNIGLIYRDQGYLDKAIEHFQRNYELRKNVGDRRGVAIALYNLAEATCQKEHLSDARSHISQYHEVVDQFQDPNHKKHSLFLEGLIKCFEYLSRPSNQRGSPDDSQALQDSLEKFERAIELTEEQNAEKGTSSSKTGFFKAYRYKGILHRLQEDFDSATETHKGLMNEAQMESFPAHQIAISKIEYAIDLTAKNSDYLKSKAHSETSNVPTILKSDEKIVETQLEKAREMTKEFKHFEIEKRLEFAEFFQEMVFNETLPEDEFRAHLKELQSRGFSSLRNESFYWCSPYLKQEPESPAPEPSNAPEQQKHTPPEPDDADLYDSWDRISPVQTLLDEEDLTSLTHEELRKLIGVISELSSELQPEILLEKIVDTAIELTDAERGFLAILSDSDQYILQEQSFDATSLDREELIEKLAVKVARNYGKTEIDAPRKEMSRNLMAETIQKSKPILTSNVRQEQSLGQYQSIQDLNLTSVVAVPLLLKQQPIGAIYLDNPSEVDAFSEKSIFQLTLLSNHASITIQNALLYENSIKDRLSELYSHNYFQNRMAEELTQAGRDGEPLSMIMIDVDGFKRINDIMGHQAGDDLIKGIGNFLKDSLRGYDTTARRKHLTGRYGGDEFEIILPKTAQQDAVQISERLINDISERTFIADGNEVEVTFSIGIACFPEHGTSAGSLFKKADEAMLEAKRRGGGDYQVYSSEEQLEDQTSDDRKNGGEDVYVSRENQNTMNILRQILNSSSTSWKEKIQITLNSVVESTEAQLGYVLMNNGNQEPEPICEKVAPEVENDLSPEGDSSPNISISSVENVLEKGQGMVVEDAVEDPDLGQYQSVMDLELHSLLIAPIQHENNVIGTIYLDNPMVAGRFDDSDLEFVTAIANELSDVLHKNM